MNKNRGVSKEAVKRLLRKDTLSALQVGRIMFLNNCMLAEGNSPLYNAQEHQQMIDKIPQTQSQAAEYTFYLRLVTYSVNAINESMFLNLMAARGRELIMSQIQEIKKHPKNFTIFLKQESTIELLMENREVIRRITAYKDFYHAMKQILGDRRLINKYEMIPQSRKTIAAVKKFDELAEKLLNSKQEVEFVGIGLDKIETAAFKKGQEKARTNINNLVDYLHTIYNPNISADSVATDQVTTAIMNNHFTNDYINK